MSKYLARRSDGAIFKQNKDGTYSMVNTGMFDPYKYSRESLNYKFFEEVEEKDFPFLRQRRNEYHAFSSWEYKNDGHGGKIKRGTIEEFRQLPDYKKRLSETDERLGKLI